VKPLPLVSWYNHARRWRLSLRRRASLIVTLLTLIRHARTAWNDTGRMQGWADPPLDEHGRAQARALAERLRFESFAAVYSSPLQRARHTAEAIAGAHGLEVSCRDDLRERNVGEWTGLTFDETRALAPEQFAGDWRVQGAPGGETQAALTARVAAAVDEILASHPDGRVAVVSHGGALSAALAHLLGIPIERGVSFSFHNTALARVVVRPRAGGPPEVRVLGAGDDRHLEALAGARP
jgi:broad specificity phosphatase PhoE